ncbi:MAG TPA: YafY family protein [Chloroflexota bacterium]
MNRTDRLLALLLELQARGTARGEDLARHFEVSLRTIYRDLEALAEGGVPIVATPGKGYELMPGYFLPPLHFTADEAATLALGSDLIRQRVDPALQGAVDDARRKLEAVLPPERRDAVARWRQELTFLPPRRRGDQRRLEQLRRAVQEHRVVRLLYRGRRQPAAEPREVEPISLVYLNETWHLAAYCRLREAGRLFRLERIDELRVTAERFETTARHQLRPADDAPAPSAEEARVRFDSRIERWVRERQIFYLSREEVDERGTVFVYALRDAEVLAHWLLGWGAQAEVLAPASLRERIAREARKIVETYATADRMLSGAPP